jgi:PleD family two-component response regulator
LESDRSSELSKTSRDILKHVDQLVKSNNLEKALIEVRMARQLDPKNLYTFAYEERINELFAQRKRQEATNPFLDTSSYPAGGLIADKSDSYNRKVPALYEEFKKAGLRAFEKTIISEPIRASKEALETYKQALLIVWSDGQKTEEDIQELQDLQQSLRITQEEHEALDKQARLECYILLLKHLLQSPASKSEVEVSLLELRHSFNVSHFDNSTIQDNFTSLNNEQIRKQKIVVVDDDIQMLELLKEILDFPQYEVMSFSTSDDAFEFLKNSKIDCILCDISLETSTMNGFLFYEKIRQLAHLQHVPFIFITGLNDEVLMRTGKEMGVDDYLVKPIHRDDLLATVRGKMRRYEQLKLLSGIS